MKIVINAYYGLFEVSQELAERLDEMGLAQEAFIDEWTYDNRDNPEFVRLVEEMGTKAASGEYSFLTVVEIPDETTDYMIDDYDGWEKVIYCVDGKIEVREAYYEN